MDKIWIWTNPCRSDLLNHFKLWKALEIPSSNGIVLEEFKTITENSWIHIVFNKFLMKRTWTYFLIYTVLFADFMVKFEFARDEFWFLTLPGESNDGFL